ncbi:MAG TPA: cytochrome c oxidase assembly protein [Polyangiales bacterium]|nr:cytochrome c oxidase assembly protein [Polyangiales bacterium]
MNAPFALGLATLACVWVALPALAGPSFSAHMTMHMGVVAVAAPLLALGLARSAYDPVRRAPRWFAPIPASVVELVVVWLWHAPALHHAARELATMRALEQASFLLSGLWLWLSVLAGDEHTRDARRGSGILALLLTSMHMTLLGALLALPPRALYAHHAHALSDQHWGGAIMLVVGGIVYLLGGLALTAGLLRRAEPV